MAVMRKIYRYYGMCGTFKATTIKSLLKSGRQGYTLPVWSLPKIWKRLGNTTLRDKIEDNNWNLAALELCTLEHTLMTAAQDEDIEFLLAERGVLDNIFYQSRKENIDESEIWKVREEEERIEESYGFREIRNTVLMMEDEEFIDSVILSEPTRRAWFPDVKTYLRQQDDYLKFIFKYLKGNIRERRILDARYYLENELGEKYKEN